jgi:hypothetical protein
MGNVQICDRFAASLKILSCISNEHKCKLVRQKTYRLQAKWTSWSEYVPNICFLYRAYEEVYYNWNRIFNDDDNNNNNTILIKSQG